MHQPTTSRRRSVVFAACAAVFVAGLATACTPPTPPGPAPACGTTASSVTSTAPSGGKITITPRSNLCQVDQVLTVTGTGWSPTANNAFGIYVAFGPNMPSFWTNAGALPVAKWVHANPSSSPGQAKLNADGTFSTTITVDAQFTTTAGTFNCATAGNCKVYTMTAHGLPDRSNDTATTVTFHA